MAEGVEVPVTDESSGNRFRQKFTAEIWHEYFKSRFLGMNEVYLPNGKTLHKSRSSAELDTTEFATFMEQVEQFAAERGVYLDAVETLA